MPSRTPSHRRTVDYLALMDPWPSSWAGTDEDKPIGRDLVAVLRPFMLHLQQKNLSPRTLRRHLDNLWLIGGETIRKLHDDPTLRTERASELLLQAIAGGEAPLVHDLTEAEQTALDTTARKLLQFLSASNHSVQ
jgi:hypothetical protein